MSLFFFPTASQPDPVPMPLGAGVLPCSWRRTVGVAGAAVLAAVLHGLVFVWYLNRPEPLPLTEAAPLPMIDIALAAPASPQVVPPAPTPPEPPKPEKKPDPAPVKKAKPKPKPTPREPVAKRVEPQEEVRESAPAAPPPAPPAPVKAEAASPRNEVYTPASSTADYLNNPRPVYPSIARSRHWEGLVLLRVYVSPDGHCAEVNVQRGSGHEVLDESALEAVRKWKFVPAKRGDTAQASWVTVPIEFRLE